MDTSKEELDIRDIEFKLMNNLNELQVKALKSSNFFLIYKQI
jgi:hypothetical protein